MRHKAMLCDGVIVRPGPVFVRPAPQTDVAVAPVKLALHQRGRLAIDERQRARDYPRNLANLLPIPLHPRLHERHELLAIDQLALAAPVLLLRHVGLQPRQPSSRLGARLKPRRRRMLGGLAMMAGERLNQLRQVEAVVLRPDRDPSRDQREIVFVVTPNNAANTVDETSRGNVVSALMSNLLPAI
jgi:hypothetical protein